MKKAAKYIVLVISAIVCMWMLILAAGFIVGIDELSYPLTAVLPVVSFVVSIVGFVFLAFWGFQFSNSMPHKKWLIIAVSIILASAIIFGLAKIVNPVISKTTTEAVETFDFTHTELVNLLSENSGIDLELSFLNADEEQGKKTAFYTFETYNDTAETKTHYTITYDAATNKVTCINFNVAKSFMGDLTSARTRYYYHIMAVVDILYPNMNTDEIFDTIKEANIEDDAVNTVCYKNDKFTMLAYALDTYFYASFEPNNQET